MFKRWDGQHTRQYSKNVSSSLLFLDLSLSSDLLSVVESYWGVIILAMLGKFVIAPNFSYIYISTMELYPTPVSYRYASFIQFYRGIRMRLELNFNSMVPQAYKNAYGPTNSFLQCF